MINYRALLIILAILFGYCFLIKRIFKYEFSQSMFFTIMFIMFGCSIFSFLNILKIGFYIISCGGILSLIYFIIEKIYKKDFNLSIIKSPSFIIFIVGFIIIVSGASKIDILKNWDECSYWATMVKRLFYFDGYINPQNFHAMYYPPALTSYNYFMVKILGMHDSSIYFSQYLLIFSGICFLSHNLKWKNFINSVSSIICIILFLLLILSPFVLTLYSELPLIIILASSFTLIFIDKRKADYFFIIMMLCNATWIKSNGLVGCIVIILIALSQIIVYIKNNKKGITIKQFFKDNYCKILVVIAPFIANKIFTIFLNCFNISNRQAITLNIKEFIKVLFFQDSKNQIASNYLDALNKNYNYSMFNISTLLLIVIIIVGFVIIKRKYKGNKIIKKNQFIEIAIFCAAIIYIASLLYSYLFMFSPFEASVLASFDRYINTFTGSVGVGFLGILTYLSLNENKPSSSNNYLIILVLILLSVLNVKEIYNFTYNLLPFGKEKVTLSQIEKGKEVAEKYKDYFNDNDKIGFVAQGDYGLTIWASIYYMTPLKLYDPRFDGDIWSIRKPGTDAVENTKEVTSEEYINFIKKEEITHIVVITTTSQFSEDYSDIFELTEGKIKEGIYKYNKFREKLEYVEV